MYMRLTLVLTLTYKGENDENSVLTVIGRTKEYMEYAEKQYKDEGYTIVRASVGIHKDATRLHTHMTHVLDIKPEHIKKAWNKKFQAILLLSETEPFELRRTIWKDDNPLYDESRGLGYNLKEYENFEQIVLLDNFIGLTHQEIEKLRDHAHSEWIKAKSEKDRIAKRKQLEEDEGENIAQYIRDYISPKNRKFTTEWGLFAEMTFTIKLTVTKVAILQYYEDRFKDTGKRKFKAYSVRDTAVSFLTVENLVSKREMAEYL